MQKVLVSDLDHLPRSDLLEHFLMHSLVVHSRGHFLPTLLATVDRQQSKQTTSIQHYIRRLMFCVLTLQSESVFEMKYLPVQSQLKLACMTRKTFSYVFILSATRSDSSIREIRLRSDKLGKPGLLEHKDTHRS